MEKPVARRNWRQIAPFAREKPMVDLKTVLANPWSRKKITKKAHAGRGLETIWEIPGYIVWGVIAMVAFRIYQDFQKRR
jgi:hypothetical protein